MKSLLCALVCLLVADGCATHRDEARLERVKKFSFGGVGYAGLIPKREDWFFRILSGPKSTRLLTKVFQDGTPEAKLYALAGLHFAKSCAYETNVAKLAQANPTVWTQWAVAFFLAAPRT